MSSVWCPHRGWRGGVLHFDYAGTYLFEVVSLPKAGAGADVVMLGEVKPTQTSSREVRSRLACHVQRWCPRGNSLAGHGGLTARFTGTLRIERRRPLPRPRSSPGASH
jgi:hypothetical protein